MREQTPLAATTRDLEDDLEDLAQVVQPGTPGGFGGGEVGLYAGPLGIGKVGLWYALLMLGRVPSHPLKAPFRTVSEGVFCELRL